MINPSAPMRLEVVYESERSRQINRRISILQTRHQGTQPGSTTSFTGMNTPTPPYSDTECHSDVIPSPSLRPLVLADELSPSSEDHQEYESSSLSSSDNLSPERKNLTSIASLPQHASRKAILSSSTRYELSSSNTSTEKRTDKASYVEKKMIASETYTERMAILSELYPSKTTKQTSNLPTISTATSKLISGNSEEDSSAAKKSSSPAFPKNEKANPKNKETEIVLNDDQRASMKKQEGPLTGPDPIVSSDHLSREYKNDILREIMAISKKMN